VDDHQITYLTKLEKEEEEDPKKVVQKFKTCSQIWLIPLVDDPVHLHHKIGKRKRKRRKKNGGPKF
jgi:hypothetical protein